MYLNHDLLPLLSSYLSFVEYKFYQQSLTRKGHTPGFKISPLYYLKGQLHTQIIRRTVGRQEWAYIQGWIILIILLRTALMLQDNFEKLFFN